MTMPAKAAPRDPAVMSDWVQGVFTEHFRRLGYCGWQPTGLVSTVDPTVRFIGSTISVLKPLVLERRIPSSGVCLVQPALRTRNLALLTEPTSRPQWMSYFRAMGTLAEPRAFERTVADTWAFLRDGVGVPENRLLAHASSLDRDLVDAFRRVWPRASVRQDLREPTTYRHRYGLPHLTGRNANLAVVSAAGEPLDIGNISVIECQGQFAGVEFATGATTLLARVHDLAHPAETSPIAAAMPVDSWLAIRLADALTATVAMRVHGVRPVARGRGQILRRYLRCARLLASAAGYGITQLAEIGAAFARLEFGSAEGVGEFLHDQFAASLEKATGRQSALAVRR